MEVAFREGGVGAVGFAPRLEDWEGHAEGVARRFGNYKNFLRNFWGGVWVGLPINSSLATHRREKTACTTGEVSAAYRLPVEYTLIPANDAAEA